MTELPVNKIIQGDSLEILKTLPDESVDSMITSPPYWGLRDYGVAGQLGLEKTPEEYVVKMVEVFREVKRVLKKEGTCWLNLGDSYAGGGRAGNEGIQKWGGIEKSDERKYGKPQPIPTNLKPKDLVGIPWRVAFALQADGWWLRQDIIWHKPNPMPESVTDRCTKSHEYIFLLSKKANYYYDADAIKEPYTEQIDRWGGDYKRRALNEKHDVAEKANANSLARVRDMRPDKNGRNKRSVWTVATKPYKEAHFATFPEDLIVPMVKAGCPKNGIICDPFMGAGTTAVVAKKLDRNYIGIELNPEYVKIAEARINAISSPML
jgi:DNA modification methylase